MDKKIKVVIAALSVILAAIIGVIIATSAQDANGWRKTQLSNNVTLYVYFGSWSAHFPANSRWTSTIPCKPADFASGIPSGKVIFPVATCNSNGHPEVLGNITFDGDGSGFSLSWANVSNYDVDSTFYIQAYVLLTNS